MTIHFTDIETGTASGSASNATSITLISTSFADDSTSRKLVGASAASCVVRGAAVEIIDVRQLPLSFAGAPHCASEYDKAREIIRSSDGVIVGVPVHGWGAAGAAKNLLDILGDSLRGKPIGFLSAAGSPRAHLAIGPLALGIVFDQQVHWFPLMLQATADTVELEETAHRVDAFVAGFIDYVRLFTRHSAPTA